MMQQLAPLHDLNHPRTIPRPPGLPPPSPGLPLSLPARNVNADTIEDAYIAFIFCCNPGVKPSTNSTALREAFRIPPKSEGKTFSTFTLYDLIGKLMRRDEVKTWGDLALRLGVDPPNQEKNQSAQKIQQYAVRLKRWMKSMHIDAFFDYLYDNPHEYWTNIPQESSLNKDTARDGVAPEDDMALRALLPHIRPRRGRRAREDDDAGTSPTSKITRVDEYDYPPMSGAARDAYQNAWSTHISNGSDTRHNGWSNDLPPLSAHPQSAITPSTRAQYWADEPRSAITPTKAGRPSNKRHGPKVVSSAWRSGQGGGKTRGRPPNKIASTDGPYSTVDGPPVTSFGRPSPPETAGAAAPPWPSSSGSNATSWGHDDASKGPAHAPPPYPYPTTASPGIQPLPSLPPLTAALSMPDQHPLQETPSRLVTKPSRLSLQVPQREGAEVRLATPSPPCVTLNTLNGKIPTSNGPLPSPEPYRTNGHGSVPNGGMPPPQPQSATSSWPPSAAVATSPAPLAPPVPPSEKEATAQMPEDPKPQPVRFKDPTVRTNIDQLEAFFAHEIMTARWKDKDGNMLPGCGADEAYAIVRTVVESMLAAADTEEHFMLNVAALAGGKLLMTTTSLQITVVDRHADETHYICEWSLQLGDCKGVYKMKERVRHDKWQRVGALAKREAEVAAAALAAASSTGMADSRRVSTPMMTPNSQSSGGGGGGASGSTATSTIIAGDDADGDVDDPVSAAHWKAKYRELAEMYKRKDHELSRLQTDIMAALRDPRPDRD